MASPRSAEGSSTSVTYDERAGPTRADGVGQPASATAVRGGKTVAGDLTAVFSGRAASAVLSAISVVIATRILGPRGYAEIALVGIVANLVWNASTSWTGTAARRYGREDLEVLGRMNRITWNRGLIAAPLVAASLVLVVALRAAGALPLGLTWELVVIALATSLALMAVDHLTTMVEAGGRMRLSAGVQVVGQAAYVAALAAVFISAVRFSASSVLLLSLGAYTLVTTALTVIAWKTAIVPLEFDRAVLRRILKLSIPMIGFIVSQYVFSSIDIVILKMFRGQADVGVYAVAYQAFSVLSRIAQSIGIVFVPLFVSLNLAGRQDVVKRYMERNVQQGLFVVAVVAALAIPALPVIVPIMFSSAFAGAAVPMAVLMFGLTFFFANALVAPVLTLHEQTRAMAIVFALGAVINVVGDVVLVGVLHMGIIAPAIATSGALECMFVGYYLAAQRPLEMTIGVPVLGLVPLFAGLVPTLVWGGAVGFAIGEAAVVTASLAVLIWRQPFGRDDVAAIEKLGLPGPVKRLVVRVINLVD